MRKVLFTVVTASCLAGSLMAQDWYHDRDQRYRNEEWRRHLFVQVREDLEHINSAAWAADRERHRLARTREELTDLQMKLDHGRFDRDELNDVIDSLQKSASDQRLSPRDRDVLADDTRRLREYREHHEHWGDRDHDRDR